MTNYQLFGIACFEKDYRLSYFLNKRLNVVLIKQDNPLKISTKSKSFSSCFYHSETNDYELFLFPNEAKGHVILPKYKNIQYLILIKRHEICMEEINWSELIADTPNIMATFTISNLADKKKIIDLFEPKD